MAAKLGARKSQATKVYARGEKRRITVYKPTIDGRVVGNLAAHDKNGALRLAVKEAQRFGLDYAEPKFEIYSF